jgi:hypothetical protein
MQEAPSARRRLSALWRYGLALLFVAAALVPALLLQRVFSVRFWFLFIAAVVASAWFGGNGPGGSPLSSACWQSSTSSHLANLGP